jgi:hypothetical protein
MTATPGPIAETPVRAALTGMLVPTGVAGVSVPPIDFKEDSR